VTARRRAAVLALLAVLGAGAPAATCAAADLQPLGLGTVWVYDYRAVMRFAIEGREHAQTLQGKVTTRADGKEMRQGKEYVRLQSTYTGIPGYERQTAFQRWDRDGLHNAFEEDGRWVDRLLLALPATAGSSWSMDAEAKERRTVVGIVAVDTPWRRLTSCVKVAGEISSGAPGAPAFVTEDFYCPGVGQARSVVRGTRDGTTTDVEMSLVSFSAAGGPH
jgi:hypothetical protein